MVTATNETLTGNLNPVTLSGTFKLTETNHSGGFYTFECQGLHSSSFFFEISEDDAETSSTVDLEKVAAWLFEKIIDAVNSYNPDSGTSNISFNNYSSNIITISGTFDIVENSTSGNNFQITVIYLQNKIFDVDVDVDDAGGNIEAIDPGAIFRWLMKKLKELICPECL